MEWKVISKHKDFEVSDLGLVRNKDTGKYLKQYKYNSEIGVRLKVFISTDDGSYFILDVARLVAEAYLDKFDNKNVVDFKDGNALNCNVSNLYYRDVNTDKGYFKQKYGTITDDEYIQEAIKEYRKTYPNDYHITDEDLEQEFRIKIYTNKEKGVSRTMHFKSHIKTIHNMNGGEPDSVDISNYDDYQDEIENEQLSNEIDKVEDVGYLKNKLLYHLDNTITPRESAVLRFRYGLLSNIAYKNVTFSDECGDYCSGMPLYSLYETGKYMGVSRERIRQIEAKAMRKLRHYSRLGKYEYYQSKED